MPPLSDPFDILLAHDRWATHIVLDRCERLTPEQFSTSFPIGPGESGGLRATLTHIVGAMPLRAATSVATVHVCFVRVVKTSGSTL